MPDLVQVHNQTDNPGITDAGLQRFFSLPALLMAGGQGTRMGQPKILLGSPVSGQSLVAWHVQAFSQLTGSVFIAAGPYQSLLHTVGHIPGVQFVHDAVAGQGPLAGLLGAARVVADGWLLVWCCDNLVAVTELLPWLYLAGQLVSTRPALEAILFRCAGRDYPLLGFYRTAGLQQLEDLLQAGEARVMRFVDRLVHAYIELPEHFASRLNLNTPGQYQQALAAFYSMETRNNMQKQAAAETGLADFSHLDASGAAQMVDVSAKVVTRRTAVAGARVQFPPDVYQRLRETGGQTRKGTVTEVARIAGIMAAKKTWDLIPLCHPLMLEKCDVEFAFDDAAHSLRIRSTVSVTHKTGVEMEALTAASVAALTIYDMCKALSHDIVITDLQLLSKTGGKRDF